ncbi:MAG: exosortase N [Saprospiraceae bacterium]|nr:exosortase N [Saprospiraceae bacterium]
MTKTYQNTAILCLLYGTLIGFVLHNYLVTDATFVVGLIVLPFCFQDFAPQAKILRGSVRHIFWLTPTLVLAIWTQSLTLFYLACVGSILLIWETQIRRLTALPFLLFLIISPLFRYVTDVFSFDFRLKLTEIAAFLLQKIDPSVSAVGNLVKLKDGSEWQIDEACMGLNMLGISLILTIFFITYFAKHRQKRPLLRGIVLSLNVAILLNIFCNLLRIIALVHFKIAPHTMAHDAVGLMALTMYVVAPMYFFVNKMAHFDWFLSKKIEKTQSIKPYWSTINSLIFIVLLAKGLFLFFKKNDSARLDSINIFSSKDFKKSELANGITQFSNDSLLIYVKPLKNFYTTEHSPMICWRGSGFVFQKIEKIETDNTLIYKGILSKGDSTLHTAWWFEDEHGKRTVDQIAWRWATITEGSHFRLVNVNAADELTLKQFITSKSR